MGRELALHTMPARRQVPTNVRRTQSLVEALLGTKDDLLCVDQGCISVIGVFKGVADRFDVDDGPLTVSLNGGALVPFMRFELADHARTGHLSHLLPVRDLRCGR
jgi:hypothetical protein